MPVVMQAQYVTDSNLYNRMLNSKINLVNESIYMTHAHNFRILNDLSQEGDLSLICACIIIIVSTK